MKREVVSTSAETTVREAARLVVESRIGTLPVVNEEGILIGVVRLEDLLRVFMPDFVALLDDIGFVDDFGALESRVPGDVPQAAQMTLQELIQLPVAVKQSCGLIRAFATMVKHQLRDLPVVDDAERLVGIASRVDIAVAFLRAWTQED